MWQCLQYSNDTMIMQASTFITKQDLDIEMVLQVSNKKETPQERLKRLMAAQLNKQVAKDNVKSAQRVAHEEKERKARVQIERLHYDGGRRSPSPDRYRSVWGCCMAWRPMMSAELWNQAQHQDISPLLFFEKFSVAGENVNFTTGIPCLHCLYCCSCSGLMLCVLLQG